jgi:hypothetical protein
MRRQIAGIHHRYQRAQALKIRQMGMVCMKQVVQRQNIDIVNVLALITF